MLLYLYTTSYKEIDKIYRENKLTSHRWLINEEDNYLIPMQTILCVIGRKQLEIERDTSKKWESASDYYKIWSYSSYLGM